MEMRSTTAPLPETTTAPAVQTRSYHIWTMGCQMNAADSRRLAQQLEHVGFLPNEKPEEADIVVLNTCVVKQQAEDRIYGRLGSLKTVKERRPGLTIALMGCMVGVKEAPRLKKAFPYVDVFMPPSDTQPLLDHLQHSDMLAEMMNEEARDRAMRDAIQDSDLLLPLQERGKSVTAFVPVVLGCSHACSFCIIPYRRGKERSREAADIVAEARNLASQGVREIMLLGQIVDRYGADLEDTDLADLLRAIHDIEGLDRIRFLTSHPNWMTDKLLDTVAELPKCCPHFEVPIQAGNDEVLTNMRRGYTVAQYMTLIERIRSRIPDAAINTDIIVGFPGETEEQFMDTLRVCEEVRFDKIHLSRYSERPRTVAARFHPDDVPEDEKERRRALLDDRQRTILEEKNHPLLDTVVEVLVEERSKGRWRGRTPHNRLVFFDDDADRAGQLVSVRIRHTSAYSLIGERVDA